MRTISANLLELRDRAEWQIFRRGPQDFDLLEVDLEAAGRALVAAQLARDRHRAFRAQTEAAGPRGIGDHLNLA